MQICVLSKHNMLFVRGFKYTYFQYNFSIAVLLVNLVSGFVSKSRDGGILPN